MDQVSQISAIMAYAKKMGYKMHFGCAPKLKAGKAPAPVGMEVPCAMEPDKPYPQIMTNAAYDLHVLGVPLPCFFPLPVGTTLLSWPSLAFQ